MSGWSLDSSDEERLVLTYDNGLRVEFTGGDGYRSRYAQAVRMANGAELIATLGRSASEMQRNAELLHRTMREAEEITKEIWRLVDTAEDK